MISSSFYGKNGKRKERLMKLHEKSFKYLDISDCQILLMPYKNKSFSFCVVLPKNKTSDPILLDSTDLIKNILGANQEDINITLPKFTREQEIDMMPFLKSLGMDSIFGSEMEVKNMIDFIESPSLKIKQVVKIIVSEDGTEIASTTCTTVLKGSRYCPKRPIDFVANHPFAYHIIYEQSKLVLFSGVYV